MAGSTSRPMEALEVFEELAQADASVAWCVWNGNTHWTAAQLSPEAARTIHADPDVITANSTRASGQAQVVAGGYRVSGRWSLVSGCELATWMVLLCVVHEDAKPRLTPAGAPETRFMLLPAAACEIIDTWTVGGLRGTGSHDVVVRDVFVPIDLWVGLCRSACPARAALSHPAVFPRHPRPRRDGAWHRPNRNRHFQRDRRREDAAADDPDAPRQPWCAGSGISGGITRALGAAVSVRQSWIGCGAR